MNLPPFKFRGALSAGLRRYADDGPETGLAQMYNRKPWPQGAVPIDALTNPVTGASTTFGFPYPILIEGSQKNLYFQYVSSAHHLYEMATGTWAAGSDKISTNQLPNVTGSGNVTLAQADNWSWAEKDDIFFLTNGSIYLTNAPVYGAWKAGINTSSAVPRCFCIDKDDRLLMANFSYPANYYTSGAGGRLWDVLGRKALGSSFSQYGSVPDSRFICWGLPLGGDIDWPYSFDMSFLSLVNNSVYEELMLDAYRDGSMSFCFVPWAGSIRKLERLGDVIMVYGSENIGYLTPMQGGGYTPHWIMGVGIPSLRSACGTDNEHIFLDKKGFLWRISSGLKLELLGYQEFLSSFVSANPIISYDSSLGEYYISKADKGYILSKSGLGEVRYAPTSLIAYNSALYGPAYAGSAGYSLKSSIINFDSRKVRTAENIELGKETPANSTCLLKYRAKTGTYKQTSAIDFNAAGIVDLVDTGIDFEVTLASTSDSTEVINYANLNFRDTDEKRGIAGYSS